MTNALYTAEAHVTGGRQTGHGRTADGVLDVALRPPKELGGDGTGTNPEQLFAVGYAACFESALLLAAQRHKLPDEKLADAAIDSRVMLVTAGQGRLRLAAELDVSLPSVDDPEEAADLVRQAHGICPYSNAIRGNVDVSLKLDGQPLEA